MAEGGGASWGMLSLEQPHWKGHRWKRKMRRLNVAVVWMDVFLFPLPITLHYKGKKNESIHRPSGSKILDPSNSPKNISCSTWEFLPLEKGEDTLHERRMV